MGNISSNDNYSERFPLDDSFEVVLHKTMTLKGCAVVDTWSAKYSSFGRISCELNLTKTNRNEHEQELSISINDHPSSYVNDDVEFQMDATVKEELVLATFSLTGERNMQQPPERKTPIEEGGVLKSSSFLYGGHTERKGLIVILREKRSDDDEALPCMIRVKHYYVDTRCSHGVSVVANIRSNGGLSVEIEKPYPQLKRDMLSIFDHVEGTGWCPDPSSAVSNQNKNPTKVNARPDAFSYSINSRECASKYGGARIVEYPNKFKHKLRWHNASHSSELLKIPPYAHHFYSNCFQNGNFHGNENINNSHITFVDGVKGNWWIPNTNDSAYNKFKLSKQENGKIPGISISDQQNNLGYGNYGICRSMFDVVKEGWRPNPSNSAYELKFSNQKNGKLPGISISCQQNNLYHDYDGAVNTKLDNVKGKGWRPNPSRIELPNQNKGLANANHSAYSISRKKNKSLISNGGEVNGNGNGSIIFNNYSIFSFRFSIVKMVIK